MKTYRRNWMMGMALVVASVGVYLISSPGTVKTVALYAIGAGLTLAGGSGSVWMDKEKLSEKS